MDAAAQPECLPQSARFALFDRLSGPFLPLRPADVHLYRICDDLSEVLVYLMVIFSPWAFGTTQPWSIWIMNAVGYLLGGLLTIKLSVRWLKGYRPPRWGGEPGRAQAGSPRLRPPPHSWFVATLASLTVAIVVFHLISALNARATYHRDKLSFEYHPCVQWLPHSLDGNRTWFAFWSCLGLACSFWAVRDWLLGKSSGEERAEHRKTGSWATDAAPFLPARLRRLLWVLSLNGALLAVEGIAQRLEGSGKLLFLVKPRVNPDAVTQFGPYAYRANAAQYFNLLWPVTLGFWWIAHRAAGLKRKAHHLLLLGGTIMAACPSISTSRGGALITVGIAALAAVLLFTTHFAFVVRKKRDRRTQVLTFALLTLFFAAALALGYSLGWKALKPRLTQINEGFAGRARMSELARPMAADYPLFGTGPGTFEPVFQLYRGSTKTYWPAQLHNDWLETRITLGWAGSSLVGLALVTVFLRWFGRGGIHAGRRFVFLLWLALAGCLVHARFDFPFQIHSIVFLFLIVCAVLFDLSRRR